MTKTKNSLQFIIITVITFLIIIMFALAIRHFIRLDTSSYSVNENSSTYDSENNYIAINSTATLKMGLDGNYKLINVENMLKTTYNLGNHAIIREASNAELKLYGVFYEVEEDGQIKRLSKENKVNMVNGAKFYKISDRKYLLIDKKISSSDGSINTKDYLIVEIDRNGNSTLYNDLINVKEINPLVLNTSSYDFDIANELLGLKDTVIDLKKIIGSTNNYVKKEEENEETPNIDSSTINSTTDYLKQQIENLRKQVEASNDYYNSYFKTVTDVFNNLNSSLQDTNKQQYNIKVDQNTIKSDIKNYNLSKWLSLGIIETGVTTLKINYNVFDPNNEYVTVYLDISGGKIQDKDRYYLNKEKTSTMIRNLDANTNYTISLGYTINANNESTAATEDVVSVRTRKPSYELKITRITQDGLYYYLKMDSEYKMDKATLNLYSDTNHLASIEVSTDKAIEGYEDFISVDNLGYKIELKLENIYYNGTLINLDIYSKFVNADD